MFDEPTSLRAAHEAADGFAQQNGLLLMGRCIDGDLCQPDPWPIYMPPVGFPAGWWVFYAVDDASGLTRALKSSTLIGVSKWTGGARILGSAGDEG